MCQNGAGVKYSIDRIEVNDACLTGRAGLALISKYPKAIGIEKVLSGLFSFLKKSAKGTPLVSIFHQLLFVACGKAILAAYFHRTGMAFSESSPPAVCVAVIG